MTERMLVYGALAAAIAWFGFMAYLVLDRDLDPEVVHVCAVNVACPPR